MQFDIDPSAGGRAALDALAALGVPYETSSHPEVRSLEEDAAARGLEPSAITKTLVVRRGDDDHVLVIIGGDRGLSWPKLRAALGVKRLSLAQADEARRVTGYPRGMITPFGALETFPVIVDAALTGTVSIGAGELGLGAQLDAADLARGLDAQMVDVTEPR